MLLCDEVAWIHCEILFLCVNLSWFLFVLDQQTTVRFPFSYIWLTLLRWGGAICSVMNCVFRTCSDIWFVLWLSVHFLQSNCHSIWLGNPVVCSDYNNVWLFCFFCFLATSNHFPCPINVSLLQRETLWLLPFFFIIPISCKVWGLHTIRTTVHPLIRTPGAGHIRAHYTWTVMNAWLFIFIETNVGHSIQWPFSVTSGMVFITFVHIQNIQMSEIMHV